jgi:hypothetical protein
MDAATLYILLTMSDESQTTATYKHDTLRNCRASAEFMREVQQANPESPIVSLRCEPRRNTAYHMYCDTLMTSCWHERRNDTDDPYPPRKEPEVPDRFDERGMPGMRR